MSIDWSKKEWLVTGGISAELYDDKAQAAAVVTAENALATAKACEPDFRLYKITVVEEVIL